MFQLVPMTSVFITRGHLSLAPSFLPGTFLSDVYIYTGEIPQAFSVLKSQLAQPFLMRPHVPGLQSLNHLICPSPNSLHSLHITLVLGSPEVDPALQLCHVEGQDPLPPASSQSPPDIGSCTIDLLCHRVILLLRVNLVSTSTPRPFPGELLSSSQPPLCTIPPHIQDFTLPCS